MTPVLIWMLSLTTTSSALEQGRSALAAYDFEQAITILEAARRQGRHGYDQHVELYEQLGIAYASLGREPEARSAFHTLLALDPGHAIRYTLSPKVTFLFDRLRREVKHGSTATLDLNWPLGLRVTDPVPIAVHVIADPARLLRRARLHSRPPGAGAFTPVEVRLPPPGSHVTVTVPPSTSPPRHPGALDIYLVALDDADNEVLLLASADRPRRIALDYQAPRAWWQRWWVWGLASGVIAAATGVGIYLGTRPAPSHVDLDLSLRR